MKKFIFFATIGALLAIGMLFAGCAPKPQATPNRTQNVTGAFGGISANLNTVLVVPQQGNPQEIPITPSTQFFLDGVACPLEEVLKIQQATNVTYNCSVFYDDEVGAQNVYIAK